MLLRCSGNAPGCAAVEAAAGSGDGPNAPRPPAGCDEGTWTTTARGPPVYMAGVEREGGGAGGGRTSRSPGLETESAARHEVLQALRERPGKEPEGSRPAARDHLARGAG